MPFTDVPVGSYYYDAVLWAVENGITKGTSDTTFSPNMTCSRAQIVAFLWRSEKSPAAGTANPFADVKSTAYYADAVLWAVKENITKGTTSTTFSPNADCTRAVSYTHLMFNLLCDRADNVHGGRLPHHVRVLWDEAANTGQVPGLEKLVAVIRSREISLCLLYQQLAQCKAIYDKNAETILGNMDSVLFLGGREASTIKEISENWLGKATISMQTEGRSRGNSESYSQNTQRLGRELMTPSELATMPGDRCVLQLRGLPPFYSRKYD